MGAPISGVPINLSSATQNPKPLSSSFHPTVWGDHFLTCHPSHSKASDGSREEETEGLKEHVRRLITGPKTEPHEKLDLIDAIQRLGIDYHFKREIDDQLQNIYQSSNFDDKHDLYTVALGFRLFRRHGIRASCEIFKKFKDEEGNFKQSLREDVLGMLNLYEASHLSIRGEEILDEALAFTTMNLQAMLPQLDPPLAAQVSCALNRPIRKCIPRIETRQFIDAYSISKRSYNPTLLKFAKLDFNMVQKLHQKELFDITQWWKSLDVATKLPYARDRVVECYFWIMAIYFEPQYSFPRTVISKILAVTSLFDDTYDNYATSQELNILTQAIERWDMKAKDALPEYMKMIYAALLELYQEFEEYIVKQGRALYSLHYAIEEMKKVMRAYLAEAKWRDEHCIPTMEEYLQVSLVTSCYPMIATTSFIGFGEMATIEAYEWASKGPKAIRASSIVCRFMNDIVSHEFEQTRKHVVSSIECYIRQYGVSEEEVIKFLRKEIANAWKDLNEECLNPTPVPMALLERVLNLTRVIDVIYKYEDGYTNSYILKDCIASIFKDPVSL